MQSTLQPTYLPFERKDLAPHFTHNPKKNLDYYEKSSTRYNDFLYKNPETAGMSLTEAKTPRQIEKDERFWTITATKKIFDSKNWEPALRQLLTKAYGPYPPIENMSKWEDCVKGSFYLYYEACLPTPQVYHDYLLKNLRRHQMIPYVLDVAKRDQRLHLEGPTHVDAMFVNVSNGFAWLIEAKVLSDVSYMVSFDNFRNQIVRNIDVMLEKNRNLHEHLDARDPKRSLFSLLTPAQFKENPQSRLYGWLMNEYRNNPNSLSKALPHRKNVDWKEISNRLGWLTFEDFYEVNPESCPWLTSQAD